MNKESYISWQHHFQQLVEYKKGESNNVPSVTLSRHPHLLKWLKNQRAIYHRGDLPEERKDRLDAIGIVWTAYDIQIKSEVRFEYKRTKGGHWLRTERQANNTNNTNINTNIYHNNHHRLTTERREKLESIGFPFPSTSEENRLVVWDSRFQQLAEYKRTYGNCYVPFSYDAALGRWVDRQRAFLIKHLSMRNDRVAKRESPVVEKHRPMDWNMDSLPIKQLVDWETRFQQLVDYQQIHGNCFVPLQYPPNPELGRWVFRHQSVQRGTSLLRNDRIAKLESIEFLGPGTKPMCEEFGAKLESIGFQVDSSSTSPTKPATNEEWDTFFEELRDYVRTHGDCNVPETYHLNPSLVEWIRKQRHDYSLKCSGKISSITAEREAKLNVLGFLWEKRESPLEWRGSHTYNTVPCPDEITSGRKKRKAPGGWNEDPFFGPDEVLNRNPFFGPDGVSSR